MTEPDYTDDADLDKFLQDCADEERGGDHGPWEDIRRLGATIRLLKTQLDTCKQPLVVHTSGHESESDVSKAEDKLLRVAEETARWLNEGGGLPDQNPVPGAASAPHSPPPGYLHTRSGQAVAAPAGTRAADFAAWWEAKSWWEEGEPPAYRSEAQAVKDGYVRAFLAGRRSGEEKERELLGLYADAVIDEDASDFMQVLINRAEHAGFTKDGKTLTEAGQAALDGVMKAGTE